MRSTTGRACPSAHCPTSPLDARRRRDDLLHLRHDRQAEGRARHAPQHHDHIFTAGCRRGARVPAARRGAAGSGDVAAARSRCSPCRSSTSPAALRSMIPAVFGGGKLVLMRKWDAEQALQLIERERVTLTGGVPTIAWQLIEHPAATQLRPLVARSDRLRRRAVGAGAGAAHRRGRSRNRRPGNGWGMTETSASFAGNIGGGLRQRASLAAGPPPTVGAMRDHERRRRRASCRSAKSASCGSAGRSS